VYTKKTRAIVCVGTHSGFKSADDLRAVAQQNVVSRAAVSAE
jgi:hypothetical protein